VCPDAPLKGPKPAAAAAEPVCPDAPLKRPRPAADTGHVLVLFVLLSPSDMAEFLSSAAVPPEAQTPEFLRLCERLDGAMPGESGGSRSERREIHLASEALEALCRPFMPSDDVFHKMSSRVCLPAGAAVTRVVTVSFNY
jgi:hypothetical protein